MKQYGAEAAIVFFEKVNEWQASWFWTETEMCRWGKRRSVVWRIPLFL